MNFFDLHCDTLTVCCEKDWPLRNGSTEVSLEQAEAFESYRQVFAVFIPDELRGEAARMYFLQNVRYFRSQLPWLLGNVQPILAVEGGCVLEGKLEQVRLLTENNVKLLTLTWNGDNEIASGVSGSGGGLTPFGRQLLPKLEQQGIVIDVSHLNDVGFEEVAERAQRPFVASHSNARSVCSHPRNLTDRQFCAIRDRGGLVGLNFHRYFLTEDGEQADFEAVRRHIEHFLELDGAQTLAIGSDFDGASITPCLSGTGQIGLLYEYLSHFLQPPVLDALFYDNAARFYLAHMSKAALA